MEKQDDAVFTWPTAFGYIDGSRPCPSPTLPNSTASNHAQAVWVQQDQLILSSLSYHRSKNMSDFEIQAVKIEQRGRESWMNESVYFLLYQ